MTTMESLPFPNRRISPYFRRNFSKEASGSKANCRSQGNWPKIGTGEGPGISLPTCSDIAVVIVPSEDRILKCQLFVLPLGQVLIHIKRPFSQRFPWPAIDSFSVLQDSPAHRRQV